MYVYEQVEVELVTKLNFLKILISSSSQQVTVKTYKVLSTRKWLWQKTKTADVEQNNGTWPTKPLFKIDARCSTGAVP